MKSPKVKGIGEVVTEYGAKVMKIFKKGLLQRSLFDFYGDVKANAIRVKESSSVPQTPVDNDGGVVYVKNSDGKLYYKSNEVSEIELSASDNVLTTEQVQDIAGSLVATGGTKTGITITYDDANNDMDFVVDHDAATNYVAEEHYRWDNDISGTATINAANIPTLNQNTTGSAATLTTPRAINGVNFDGSAPITITAAGSTLSDTVPVSKGGTGATSFADKAVIITQDSGTDTLAAVTMSTNGQLLIGGTDGPAVATLTQGNGITITNANGGITLAVDSDIDTSGESGTVDNIGNLTGDVTSSNRATTIANDAVTYAKMQNVSATNVVLGRDSAGAGVVEEISAANLRTILNVADGATADQTKADIDALGIAANTAGTVTNGVYTLGDQTIAGTKTFSSTLTYSGSNDHSLSLNNTSATGSPFISFNQNGSRKSFIQHNDTGDTIKIASEYGGISLQTGVSGAETAYLDIENDGVIRFGAVDADSVLTTDGNMTFRIDADNDETSQKFAFQNNASTEVASIDESGLLTSMQRHLIRCGFYGNASRMYLPFNYGGTFESTSTSGYSEYGAVIMPCDGYVESVIIRSEAACGNSIVTILVASNGTEVPTLSPGSFSSPTVDMAADDTSYKFTGFVDISSNSNSFSAGDVIMIAFDPTNSSYDTTATAVLVFDWNNQL